MKQNTKLEHFEIKWENQIEDIKGEEFSPKQCRNIYIEFTSDVKSIISDPSIDFKESERVIRSVRTDLTVALEQAKSNYREQLVSLLEKIKFHIELKVFNF